MLLPGHEKNAANRLYSSTFAADYPTHVVIGDPHLDSNVLSVGILSHLDSLRLADQRGYDLFNSFFHTRPVYLSELCGDFGGVILDQTLDRVGRLGANADPILDAVVV